MLFNVGIAEIAVIAVIGLMIFGPEKLPRAIQTLMNGVRALRETAGQAGKSLQEASGMDGDETRKMVNDIAELHPKRWASGVIEQTLDVTDSKPEASDTPAAESSEPASNRRDLDPDLP